MNPELSDSPPAIASSAADKSGTAVGGALEALLLLAAEPMSVTDLAQAVAVPEAEVAEALVELAAFYDETGRGFELRELGGGWRYYTRDEYADLVTAYVLEGQQSKLSVAALETLAVIAYRQPISRGRVSAIRGVNVDGVIRTLLARGLIEEAGHDVESGAVVFATTSYFLERMGLRTLDELPPLAPHLPGVEELEAELGQLAEVTRGRPVEAGRAGSRRPLVRIPEGGEVGETGPVNESDDIQPEHVEGQRLQKVLAAAGLASRRASEVLISEGRVEVNGRVVTEQGRRVDPDSDVIRVDGSRIPPPRRHLYLVLNKPRGVVSTLDDPQGRRTVNDLLDGLRTGKQSRLFHVGRLDTDTEGLLLLTNDGDFAQRMTHPSFAVPKTYLAEVDRRGHAAGAEAAAAGRHARRRAGAAGLGEGRLDRRRPQSGQDHVARGPEPHRAPYHGGGRSSGPAAVPDRDRTGAARDSSDRGGPGADPGRAGRPARPHRRLTAVGDQTRGGSWTVASMVWRPSTAWPAPQAGRVG